MTKKSKWKRVVHDIMMDYTSSNSVMGKRKFGKDGMGGMSTITLCMEDRKRLRTETNGPNFSDTKDSTNGPNDCGLGSPQAVRRL